MKREPLPDLDCSEPAGTSRRLLHEILAEQQAQREILSRILQALDPAHELGALVREVSNAIGDCTFTCAELLEHAQQDPNLLAAIEQATGTLDANSAKRLGKALAGCVERDLGGYRVVRVSCAEGVRTWSVHAGV